MQQNKGKQAKQAILSLLKRGFFYAFLGPKQPKTKERKNRKNNELVQEIH